MHLKEHDAPPPLPIDPAPAEAFGVAVAPLSLACLFDGPYGPSFGFGASVDPVALADMGIAAITGDLARLRIILGISVFAATVSGVTDPMADAAVQALARQEMLSGLTLGVVLTADGRSPTWIKQHGFVKMWPVRQHPRHGRQLQGIYNTSLMAGIAQGRQFSPMATRNLFAFLLARMSAPARQAYGSDQGRWKSRQWEVYYRACAGLLQREIDQD
ncbi:MAG TPA: hypothetical protein VJR58_32690 [Vineibacter sp.]|nr:hypothetical protein [Vineibacter sp.]